MVATTSTRFTHTNSDKDCLRPDAGILRRFIYWINVHMAWNFLTEKERLACHIVLWSAVVAAFTYTIIFSKGVYDGILASTAV